MIRLRLRAVLLASCVALSTLGIAAAEAAETPVPAGPDPRVRVIAYNATEVVRLLATPGATLTIQLAPGERVVGLPVSDQALLDAPAGDAPPGLLPSDRVAAGRATTADRNLQTAVEGNFVMLKPLRDLAPQPLFILGQSVDPATGRERLRAYTFEISTRAGPLTMNAADAVYLVRFRYPDDERAAAAAAATAAAAARREAAATAARAAEDRAARDRLRQQANLPSGGNRHYDGQGDRDLAPAAIWDDGRSTFLRFPGNRRIPSVYAVHPDGREAAVNSSVSVDGLLTIHQTGAMFRLRDGGQVLCIFNRAFNATGQNSGTGTTSPDVVREIRR